MKNIIFKKIFITIIILLVVYIMIDAVLNWDEAVAAFDRGYNNMNQINEQRSKEHLK
ncbi:hypothetical protein [Faecalibacter rhinopitheci]|uniref:Uncharacterized protein n=1 Tax=Faecalibacter rhinopitheci TaxID=2779678 RepID=A0A8J7FY00_9FLAO|nr:hypothetical protein [Faecalibacter rhinopitheci]MBF0597738.1 hypothetical protein [Faecalibacter rhinopitheci]